MHARSEDMGLAILLWLCSLPLVLLLVPLGGAPLAGYAALALLVLVLVLCWGLCGWRRARNRG